MILSQDLIVRNIDSYLALKNRKMNDAQTGGQYAENQGLCAGLVAYWLYLIRNDEEGFFIHRLQYLADWNVNTFERSGKRRDEIIESFFDNVLLLNESSRVVSSIKQSDLNASFNLGLSKHQDKVSLPEFSLSFIFNKTGIQNLIAELTFVNKMIRFSNGLHVIGLMYKNDTYTLYDPNSSNGPLETTDLNLIAEKIYTGFSSYCKSKNYIAMNVSIYDIENAEPAICFDPLEYCVKQLSNRAIKNEVMQHKFILFLLAKYNEFKIMDLLFENGYNYIPWSYHARTEMNEAIVFNDKQKLKYLLDHGLPIDPKNLLIAIEQKSSEFLYMLLAAGAMLNSKQSKSYLSLALEHNFPEGIVLLLVSGIEVNNSDKAAMQAKYGDEGMNIIIDNTLQLHQEILQLPMSMDLNNVTGETLSDYAKHYKLGDELGVVISNIIVTRDGVVISPEDIVTNIMQIFQAHPLDNEFSISEKEQIEDVLIYFQPKQQKKQYDDKKKLEDLKHAAIELATKFAAAPDAVSKSDIFEAQMVLEKIPVLSFNLDAVQDKVCENAQRGLMAYLNEHHLKSYCPQFNSLSFKLTAAKHPSIPSYTNDIEAPLQKCSTVAELYSKF